MAELKKIDNAEEEFRNEYFYRNSKSEENREKEHRAATQIQSCIRACNVQGYLSHLHKKAVIIQKTWRGFTARAHVRKMVKAAFFIMKMNFYEEMAVRIQKMWRGFFSRKNIHNFYARKCYLEGVILNNELMRKELDETEELRKSYRKCCEMVKEHQAKIHQAYRLHHLLSTKQHPGVFNSPFRSAPHEMELLLRKVKYKVPNKLAYRSGGCLMSIPDQAGPSFSGTIESPLTKFTRPCDSRPKLPPITSKKQQDLLEETWKKHLQCPELLPCLQTSYTHLEEAQNQLQQKEAQMTSLAKPLITDNLYFRERSSDLPSTTLRI